MPSKPSPLDSAKKRGGSHSARSAGLTGVVVHFTAQEKAAVKLAATLAGAANLKAWCRQVILAAAAAPPG